MADRISTRYLGYAIVVDDQAVRVIKNGRALATVPSVKKARLYVRADRRNRKQVTA